MHVKSLARTFALAVAVFGFLGSSAKADNFLFSITNNAGNTTGTVTGEIFGLVNNSTGPATEVQILTIPPTQGGIPFDPNTIPTTWQSVSANSFTETDGIVTSAEFLAYDASPPNPAQQNIPYRFVLDSFGGQGLPYPSAQIFYLNYEPSGGYVYRSTIIDDLYLDSYQTINETQNITPTAAPEPSTAFLLSTVMLAVALVARKRIAQGR
jgi:hypothetical protein